MSEYVKAKWIMMPNRDINDDAAEEILGILMEPNASKKQQKNSRLKALELLVKHPCSYIDFSGIWVGGSIAYHLDILVKKGLIKKEKLGRGTTRFPGVEATRYEITKIGKSALKLIKKFLENGGVLSE